MPFAHYIQQTSFYIWNYFRNSYRRDAGIRIDHFLLSPQIASKLKKAGVDRHVRGWGKSSDRAPVWIMLSK